MPVKLNAMTKGLLPKSIITLLSMKVQAMIDEYDAAKQFARFYWG